MRLNRFSAVIAALSVMYLAANGRTLCAQQVERPEASLSAEAKGDDHDRSLRDLRDLETRIRSAIEKALPSIVFLGWEGGTGTGVVISPEGMVLTSGHVIGDPTKAGIKFRLSFQDGTVAEAEVVGADALYDLTLLRLVEPGTYPFTSLAEHEPVPGTGVLKFGYPIEVQKAIDLQKGRPASVRFGAVLAVKAERATESDTFVTDCPIDGGDSGGPFVDLDGRLLGIVRGVTAIRDIPLMSQYWHNLENTRGRIWFAATPSPLIRQRLARMAKGEFIQPTDAERARLDVWDMRGKNPILYSDLITERLWTQGEATLGRFRVAVADIRRSIVEVVDGDEPTALGTVVDATGLILTKASEVPEEARCRLPDGRVAPAVVVGVDPACDLALLRITAEELVPVAWAKAAEPPVGTLVAAVGTGELPVAVGVVSVARRDVPGPHPSAPHRYRRPDLIASPPELTGFTAPDGGFVVETSEGNAAAADIRQGDVILTMAGKTVPDNSWLRKSPKAGLYIPISGMNRYDQSYYTFQPMLPLAMNLFDEKARRAGERVLVRLLRGDEQIELSLRLPSPKEGELGFRELMVWSKHHDAPPTVITADIPVYHSECGAPAVGLDGTVLGLVIGRFGPTGSFIIPADVVAARLDDLKEGRPLSGFSTSSAQPAVDADGKDESARRPTVLIIGASSLNSPVPLTRLVGAMLESKGIDMHIEGEYPHLDEVPRLLSSQPVWDYVVMDAWHLGRGSADGSQGNASVPPDFPKALADFARQLRAHSPKCRIILFPWWIPRGPTATNEGVMEVFRHCVEQAKLNDIWVSTTGLAFMEARLERPDLRVTKSKTDAHPGVEGAYLNACSLFAIITGQSPVALPATLKITAWSGERTDFAVAPDDAKYLQELAWKVYQREIKNTKPAK